VTLQTQVAGIVAGSAGLSGLPIGGAQATPISFAPTTAAPAAAKPSQPVGAAPSPPPIAASPGLLPTGISGTTISPASTVEPGSVPSPTVAAQNPDRDDEGSDEGSARMKVNTGGGSANLRDKPGQVGIVVKAISDGAIVEVIGEDKQMDGKTWKNVKDEDGSQGWMAAELLESA
jgi:hypothetical protein